MKISFNMSGSLEAIIKITDDSDNDVKASVTVKTEGSDPVLSAQLEVVPEVERPFTCHILFPEITVDVMPSSIELDCEVFSTGTNLVVDCADKCGPCAALPFFHGGKWCQDVSTISMNKKYMVWKEGVERALEPPLRLKYLLAISTDGKPIHMKLSNLVINYE